MRRDRSRRYRFENTPRPAQPLTAPCNPETMRFSIARKNTSAGIIANDVKASTPAVSWAYSVEKFATPSVSVWSAGAVRISNGSREALQESEEQQSEVRQSRGQLAW